MRTAALQGTRLGILKLPLPFYFLLLSTYAGNVP